MKPLICVYFNTYLLKKVYFKCGIMRLLNKKKYSKNMQNSNMQEKNLVRLDQRSDIQSN